MCLPPHVLYCIDGEFEKILTKLRLRIKDNNNHLYRVSFVDFYFAFPTNFRVVFLPHTNTVILLEKYCCGTWLSSFYRKFLYYHSTRVACGALENLIGRSVENMASHLPAKHIT